MSVSVDAGKAFEFADGDRGPDATIIRIQAPAGYACAPVGFEDFQDELELLIGRSHRWRVIAADEHVECVRKGQPSVRAHLLTVVPISA